MAVGRICVREVDLADINESAQVAAQRMHDRNVGTLVVANAQRKPIGIVTDRDLAVRVVAKGRNPVEATVGEVMTTDLKTVGEQTSLEDALHVMRSGPFRRVPVTDAGGTLIGLLSVDDVLDLLRQEFNEIGRLLERESPRSLAGS